MTVLRRAEIPVEPPDRFRRVLPAEAFTRFREALRRGRDALGGATLWNVNSASEGGGVAEMLRSLLPYTRGASWDTRWAVMDGDSAFFHITKRLHNMLHGAEPDAPLDHWDRRVYEETIARNAEPLGRALGPGDIVLAHDPQTAGLLRPLAQQGAHVVWQCHIGTDHPTDATRRAWDFLRPFVEPADRYVFSRSTYRWNGLDPERARVIPPSIDVFTAKNQHLDVGTVRSILQTADVCDGRVEDPPTFTRRDGTRGVVRRQVERIGDGGPIPSESPIVLQVSRWDRLKDPEGAMRIFTRYLAERQDLRFVFAGPQVDGVSDDPEGAEVRAECAELWHALPEEVARRVHLLSVPTDDTEENAAVINALQRRADVVLQKSLREGFGLVVAEAMWKERPTVGSRVGGIQDQIEHGRSGLLVDDPTDLEACAEAVASLLDDRPWAEGLGRAGGQRIRDRFLGPRQLTQYVELLEEVTRAYERGVGNGRTVS